MSDKIKPATGEPYGLAGQLEQAFGQMGSSMMTNEFAGSLLAYVYVLGTEACVLHKGLNAGIQIAQQKANLYGGHIPNMEVIKYFEHFRKDLEGVFPAIKENKLDGTEIQIILDQCPWVAEIHKRYDIAAPKEKKPK